MAKALIVEILGNATQFGAELDKAAGRTRQFGKVAGVAGLAIAGGLAVGLEHSVKAAEEAQVSQARLDQAFTSSGQSSTAYKGRIEDAESAARKLGFTNVATKDALGSLEIATHDGSKAIEDLGVAQDIARFKGVGLEQASKMLTMAMAGSQRAIKQLGLSIQPSTANMDQLKEKYKQLGQAIPPADAAQAKFLDKQQTSAQVIDLVSSKLGGQAKAFADTAQGGAAQFHAQMDALQESLGQTLLPALTQVSAAMASLAGFFAQHTTTVKILVAALGALGATLLTISVATKLYAAAQVVAEAATTAWTAAQWLLNAALDANPIGVVVVALAALVGGLILAWQHSATFRAVVTGAFNAVKDAANAVLGFFRGNWPVIVTLISGPFAPIVALATNAFGVRSALTNAAEAVLDFFRGNWKTIAVLISGPFAPLVALATNAFGIRSAITNAFGDILETARTTWGNVSRAVTGALDDVVAAVRGLPGRIVKALGDVSHLLYNAGASIIQGLIDGLTSKLGEVEHLASSIAGKIAGLKGPLSEDRKLLVPHGEAIIEGLQTGMENGVSGLLSTVGGYAPSIAGAAGTATPAASTGGTPIQITVNGWVGNDQQLAERLRRELLRVGQRNGTIFGSVA